MSDLFRRHALLIAGEAPHLFACLAEQLAGLTRRKARLAVKAGLVAVGGKTSLDPMQPVPAGAEVVCDLRHGIPAAGTIRHGGRAPQEPTFRVLHCDRHVLVVDKAAGVTAVPGESGDHGHLLEKIRTWLRKNKEEHRFLGQVHRIDRLTSGCFVLARSRLAQRLLHHQFACHQAVRRYRSLVAGLPRQDADTLRGRIGRGRDGRRAVVAEDRPGVEAVTHFQVLHRWREGAELALWLETGRTHQIRVHAAAIGCPVLGDPVYGPRGGGPVGRAPRLMLHAWQVAFDHPATGENLVITAPLPPAFADQVKRMGPPLPGWVAAPLADRPPRPAAGAGRAGADDDDEERDDEDEERPRRPRRRSRWPTPADDGHAGSGRRYQDPAEEAPSGRPRRARSDAAARHRQPPGSASQRGARRRPE